VKAPLVNPVIYVFELITFSKSDAEISFFIRFSMIVNWLEWPMIVRFLPSYWKTIDDV